MKQTCAPKNTMTIQVRYNSLIKRSFDLWLRYKIYDEIISNNGTTLDPTIFKIDPKIKKDFAELYKEMKDLRDINQKTKVFIDQSKPYIKDTRKKYTDHFHNNIMSLEEFTSLWEIDERCCGYCGISEKQIEAMCQTDSIETKRFYSRGKTMEIDKIRPGGEYSKENIILSCYWCNNAKTDEFTLSEFEPIAKGINTVWNSRSYTTIDFPSKTYGQPVPKP